MLCATKTVGTMTYGAELFQSIENCLKLVVYPLHFQSAFIALTQIIYAKVQVLFQVWVLLRVLLWVLLLVLLWVLFWQH